VLDERRSLVEKMNFQTRIVFCTLLCLSLNFVSSLGEQLEVSVGKSLSVSNKNDANLKVRVTNTAGKFATPTKVTLLKLYLADQEDSVLLSKQEFTAVEGDQTSYQLNLFGSKLEPGTYTAELKVVPTDKKFSTVDNVALNFKVVGIASIADTIITVSTSEDATDVRAGKKYKIEDGKKSDRVIKAEESQHISLEFKVKGASGNNIEVQQAFLRISQSKIGREFIQNTVHSSTGYSISFNVKDLAAQFYGQTGNYDFQLIVGDAALQKPISLSITTFQLNFSASSEQEVPRSPFAPEAEIVHQFRLADKRPPQTTSLAFTGAVLVVPFLVLLIGLGQIGANFNNFPSGGNFIWAVGFQGCIGAILALFGLYWLRLNMIQTLGYLLILTGPTLFFAHRNLNVLSKVKQHSE